MMQIHAGSAMKFTRFTGLLIGLLVMLVTSGCSSGVDDPDRHKAQIPEDAPSYLLNRPELTDWSLWESTYDHGNPIPTRRIGGFGTGNGRVFSMIACKPPFTTLHNLTGPHYQKHLRFFSDKTFTLSLNGEPVSWEKERCRRVRGTAIYVTRLDSGDLSLWTVDFTPLGEGMAELLASNTLVRMIILHNRGDETVGEVSLAVETVSGDVSGNLILETILDDGRKLAAGYASSGTRVKGKNNGLVLDITDLPSQGQFVAEFVIAFTKDGNPEDVFDAVALLDPDTMLDATLTSWEAFSDQGAGITTSDAMFNDLMEGLSVTIGTQQAETGGMSQMSEYSGVWLRDIMGGARFYPLIGRIEDYRRMLDYYWLAALEHGNIANSLDIDIELETLPAQPDWENLPEFSGRESAESPSYLVMHYKAWLQATGDWAPLEERYGMLRHALLRQDIRNECLLPFSDDETFRPAMAVAFGHSVFNEYQKTHLSANSSFLWVAAAEFMTQVAQHLGYEEHAQEYTAMAQKVRDCTEQHYWLDSQGFYAPMIDIETLEPVDRPFEDVNTKPLWIGYLKPDDLKAQANILNTLDRLASEDGLFYSPLHPSYEFLSRLMDVEKGVVTGMTYGYQLDNLARMDHPRAEASFLMYRRFFHGTGNVSEGEVVDDFGRFVYLYEPFGFVCDLTARYRSWEGGINGAAMIQYLFGLELDALNGRIGLAPHLPEGWDFAEMQNGRFGDVRFRINVEDHGKLRRVTVDRLTGPLRIDATVSVTGDIQRVVVNGTTVQPPLESQWGRSRALLPDLDAGIGKPLVIEVTRAES